MAHPYLSRPPRAFWRSGVAQADRMRFPDLYQPRAPLTRATRVATAGSCFAQHIGRYLRLAGCHVLDAEPAPHRMPETVARAFGYGIFSGRYGNIYTARQMLQLLEDVIEGTLDPRYVWEKDGRFVDAFRPTVEPRGLGTVEEVLLHRAYHLERTAQMLRETDLLVFTLGLTEAWEDRRSARVFPVCPGVAAGTFDPAVHAFRNFRTTEIADDLSEILALLRQFNPAIRMLVTVSPVPLTATATDAHVLTATTNSKSALRAAAGEFTEDHPEADYFPSYELVTAPAAGPDGEGSWFDANLRSVRADAVERVMGVFLAAHGLVELPEGAPAPGAGPLDPLDPDEADDLVCDELLLQAFAE